MSETNKIIILVDMDCFYCQVEEQLDVRLKNKPIAVVQYNAWRGGGIIAVNYLARNKGVTRHMRGDEAKEICPDIELVRVPQIRGKADLSKYRDAGKTVSTVLQTFTPLLERASVDEAYLDITDSVNRRIETNLDDLKIENMQNTFVVGTDTRTFLETAISNKHLFETNLKLAVGGLIAEEIRREVYNKTNYSCSAGIAHNKILAKLSCGLHKPNKQTILPQESVLELFETTPLRKIRSLGGKFGNFLTEQFGIEFIGQLRKFTEKELKQYFDEKTASWLYKIARGIDLEPVTTKLISKSIGCSKKFPGQAALLAAEDIEHWLAEFSEEISQRLEKDLKENNRKAKQITIHFVNEINKQDVSGSRTCSLISYDKKKIAQSSFDIIKKYCMKSDYSFHVKYLGISVGNFDNIKGINQITKWFTTENKTVNNDMNMDNGGNVKNNYTKILNNEADDNASPYSAKTEESDVDTDTLIFYDDNYRMKSNIKDTITECNSSNLETHSNSFFRKYFTFASKPLIFNEQNRDNNKEDEIKNISLNSIKYRTCSDCNKEILETEFALHLDYHYALSIVKQDRTGFKNNQVNIKKSYINNINNRKECEKNKVKQIDKNKMLSAYFTNEPKLTHDDSTEICTECKKKINLIDFANHQDYHIAKKLHLEINPGRSQFVVDKSIKKNKTYVNNRVSSYFNPL